MTGLDVFAFRLRFRVDRPGRRFLGSPWRGAFGHHLKRLVCLFPRGGECPECPLRQSCAYARVFEPNALIPDQAGSVPAPYALFPRWRSRGQGLDLHLSLFGEDAARQLPYLVHALKQAGRDGVAGNRFDFEGIEHWRDGAWASLDGVPRPLGGIIAPPAGGKVRVCMRSPLRCKHRGHYVGAREITLDVWLTALRRRLIALAEAVGDAAAMRKFCASGTAGEWREAEWRWREFPRYSRRQRSEMKVGGLIGGFALDEETARRLWPTLWLGQWTHAGKLATMGLGRYEMEVNGG